MANSAIEFSKSQEEVILSGNFTQRNGKIKGILQSVKQKNPKQGLALPVLTNSKVSPRDHNLLSSSEIYSCKGVNSKVSAAQNSVNVKINSAFEDKLQ
jgi:hypothetical protein